MAVITPNNVKSDLPVMTGTSLYLENKDGTIP
jgi:hypothetical protein